MNCLKARRLIRRAIKHLTVACTWAAKSTTSPLTKYELGKILNDMYTNSEQGEAVAMIHLFGIKYASEIEQSEASCVEIVKLSQIPPSYATEVHKGVRLSKYVRVVRHA